MEKLIELKKISKIASDWWCKVIVNPKFDNGDNSFEGSIASSLASRLVKDIDENTLKNFKKDLKKHILNELKTLEADDYYFYIATDYGPCGILYNLSEKHKINNNNFPWKTTMEISRNHIAVNYGYQAWREPLYANKTYYKNKIKSCERTLENYMKEDDDYFTFCTREECIEAIKQEKEKYEKNNSI